MHYRRVAVALALVFAFTPSLSQAQERPYTEGTVWNVSFIRTEPGKFEDYLRNLQANWREVQEDAMEAGYVVSYKILSAPRVGADDWDLMLLVEYPNWAAFDGLSERMDPITANVSGMNRGEQQQATVARGALREILGTKNAQELTLK